MIVKFLTFNIGLLDYKIFGKTIFSNPYYSEDRIKFIPDALLKYDSDIIAIQECYDSLYFKIIYNKLKFKYPYVARKDNKRNSLQLHNGLIIFSKYPIKNVNLFPYFKSDIVEKYFGNKSLLVAEILIGNKILSVFNIHLTAGCYNPESLMSQEERLSQIKELISISNYYISMGTIPIILGDFNSGPYRTPENYKYMLKNRFIDSYNYNNHSVNYTWSPHNLKLSVHGNAKIGKIDHLFFYNDNKINVLDSKIILYEKNIKIDNKYYCLSDHNALLTSLEIK